MTCARRVSFPAGVVAEPIPFFAGYYASRCGQIYSTRKEEEPTLLKATVVERGKGPPRRYVKAYEVRDGKKSYKTVGVADAVLTSFGQPRPLEGCWVAWHKNLQWLDDSLANLEWVERSWYYKQLGLQQSFKRTHCKLGPPGVRQLRQLVAQGFSHREASEQVGCSRENVTAVIAGRSWRHIQ